MKFNLTAKIMLGVSVILVVGLAANFLISNARVNDQAEEAFADKLRQITGMAGEARVWAAAHQEIFRNTSDNGEANINSVPVVMAWQIAQDYAKDQGYEFSTPSLKPRNSQNSADPWEREWLNKFAADGSLKEGFERVTLNGREYARYIVPLHIEKDCLTCHGSPAGELDPFGHSKEGMKVGDLRAAFAVAPQPMSCWPMSSLTPPSASSPASC